MFDRSGRQSVPVWGCFSAFGPGPLVRIDGRLTAERYVEILEQNLLPYAHAVTSIFPELAPIKFIQDRSPIHTARRVQQFFRDRPEIELLPWPPKGADLNPIENIWGDMVKDFDARLVINSEQLFDIAENLWFSYADRLNYHLNLAESMVNRLEECRNAEGFYAHY